MRQIFRLLYRSIWLICLLTLAALDFLVLSLRRGFRPSMRERIAWMYRNARRIIRVLACNIEVIGDRPTAGLLVSNHLSYVDIILLGSISPSVFVSKSEVREWPVFGALTRMAGTIYIRRERRADVVSIGEEIRNRLVNGELVVLFPEGTSSDGRDVLPFKSSLLQPVSESRHPLHISHIQYELSEGSVENDVCYWGDMTFFPHLLRFLSRPRTRAQVRFQRINEVPQDRKLLARSLREEILRLKNGPSLKTGDIKKV